MNTPSMQDLLTAGVHFGHQTRRGNPRMGEYIFGARDGVHIINLEHSEKLLKEAAEYAYKLGTEGKILLFIGTKKQAQELIKEVADKAGAPYINYRWLGGMLTNFDEIGRNIKKLTDLKDKQAKGELTRYTKKEQLLISRKLEKFEQELGGIAKLEKLPDALFILDSVHEKTAVNEGRRMNLPIIAITDTNSDPMLVTYPIPGNDDAAKSIKILTETIADAYAEGLKKGAKVAQEAKESKESEESKGEEVLDGQLAEQAAVAEELVEKEAVKDAAREA